MLWRLIRRKLREIDYYSANRPRTRWSRALNAALLGTLLFALPASWFAEQIIIREIEHSRVYGRLHRRDDGRIYAVIDSRIDRNSRWHQASPVGEFDISSTRRTAGWPLPTSAEFLPPTVEANVFATGERTIQLDDDDDELAEAIRRELGLEVDKLSKQHAAEDIPPPRQIANALLWWIMLYLITVVVIQSLRLIAFFYARHRSIRRAELAGENRCPECGYNLRGLEFRPHCPECGALIE